MRKGGRNCLKYLKRGWNRKDGRGSKDFKKGDQARSRVGCFKKKGGTGTPLQTMVISVYSDTGAVIGAAAQIRAVYKDHEMLVTLKICITLSLSF